MHTAVALSPFGLNSCVQVCLAAEAGMSYAAIALSTHIGTKSEDISTDEECSIGEET